MARGIPIAAALLLTTATASAAKLPHIILVVQDDLGWADTGAMLGSTWDAASYTQNITGLAEEGVRLTYMHSHWHCSPTRRSIMSGRIPLHHGEQLSGIATDDIDLRMTYLPAKLAKAGYTSYGTGKGHTGYKSMNHLFVNNEMSHWVGYLGGAQYYFSNERWEDKHPIHQDSQFVDPPPGCGNSTTLDLEGESSAPAGPASCNSSISKDTILPCGEGSSFVNTNSDTACCAACVADASCTHWVYDPTDKTKPSCHIKTGQTSCKEKKAGASSGVTRKGPNPPKPGPENCTTEYGTTLYGSVAVQAIEDHDASTPMFLYLAFQDQHTPYDAPPWSPPSVSNDTYKAMMWAGDTQLGRVVNTLKAKGMYEDTLIFYVSDNGGVELGLNYPLRGEKHSNWQGGVQVTAFVSGGALPSALRNTSNDMILHVADLYATISSIAGVDPEDGPPVAPLPVDPSNPHKNIYGNDSYPALDGVNFWPMLLSPSQYNQSSVHEQLVVSREVLIQGKYKLLVSQPLFKTQMNGWKQPNGTWIEPNMADWPCAKQDLSPKVSFLPGVPGQLPCLFDIVADPSEKHNIASDNLPLVMQMWHDLNMSVLTTRDCSGWSGPIPGPNGECSPAELLGPCNPDCADDYWYNKYGGGAHGQGPVCGVPGCT